MQFGLFIACQLDVMLTYPKSPTTTQVVSGFDTLTAEPPAPSVERYPAVGVVVLRPAEPLHYYSLFSHTVQYDTVLTMYDGQRYGEWGAGNRVRTGRARGRRPECVGQVRIRGASLLPFAFSRTHPPSERYHGKRSTFTPVELESKYTQFVNVHSRPVWPRVDMAPLARVLNVMEGTGEALGDTPEGRARMCGTVRWL